MFSVSFRQMATVILGPSAAKPSYDLLFIKLWAATLRMPEMGKSMSKTSKCPSLKPLTLIKE